MSELEGDAGRPIGSATMTQDGTLVLDLRAEAPGVLGIARLVHVPSDPRYAEWLEHLGGMQPGEQKLVPPWPETA